jgi:acyl-CoA synthetase (AMP-forming)/AMP-acid ligase II
MSIAYLPWNQHETAADRVCLRDSDAELTYTDVARRADAVAEAFAALGVGQGDVVAIMLPNCVELLLGLLAAWRLGAAVGKVDKPALRKALSAQSA